MTCELWLLDKHFFPPSFLCHRFFLGWSLECLNLVDKFDKNLFLVGKNNGDGELYGRFWGWREMLVCVQLQHLWSNTASDAYIIGPIQ